MHRQQQRQAAVSSVVHGEFEPQLLTPFILRGWSFDKLFARILLIHWNFYLKSRPNSQNEIIPRTNILWWPGKLTFKWNLASWNPQLWQMSWIGWPTHHWQFLQWVERKTINKTLNSCEHQNITVAKNSLVFMTVEPARV